jgi:hypothetical protein
MMTEPTTTPTDATQQFQAQVQALRDAPFATGESEADRFDKVSALYKARYPEPGSAAPEVEISVSAENAPSAPPVSVSWGPGEVSESDRMVRGEIESTFGSLGLSRDEGSFVIARALAARNATLDDEAYEARKMDAERTLRATWGRQYAAKLRSAYQLLDDFERRFGQHPDIAQALDNGLAFDVQLLTTLAAVADRRGVGRSLGNIDRMRAELATVNQGSPRYHELSRALEDHYRRLHGA